MFYRVKIADVERDLPLCPLSEELYIAAFVMFGDVELTESAARALCRLAPEHDVMITAESKGIPLVCSMARMLGENHYALARKGKKLYMKDVLTYEVESITTVGKQCLYLDGKDAAALKGRRVLIVDDVISTGKSLAALEGLVQAAGGEVVGKMAVLAEGDAIGREDITYLAPLPLFDKNGNPIE